ncbi:MAG TPA: phosphate ABC transporter ATP-binding protein [Byssovorax sp.]
MTAEPKLRARGLEAFFGERRVVHGVDLDMPDREITAIIGPSGCGKSTFLRCLNRMHETTVGARARGKVELDGVDVYGRGVDPARLRRRVGMVFQRPNPFPAMSIAENVLAGHRLAGTKPPHAAELVERTLRAVGLWDEVKDALDAAGTSLSGGQQQRLCIARALAVEPDAILLDEPCSALDPIATETVEELLVQLKPRVALVLVTHNLQQAARVADRTAFFLLGELIEVDATEVVFRGARDPRTRDYVSGRFG